MSLHDISAKCVKYEAQKVISDTKIQNKLIYLVTKKDYCSSVRIIDVDRTCAKNMRTATTFLMNYRSFFAYEYLN
jgi:hypothetical protein